MSEYGKYTFLTQLTNVKTFLWTKMFEMTEQRNPNVNVQGLLQKISKDLSLEKRLVNHQWMDEFGDLVKMNIKMKIEQYSEEER